MAEKEEAQLLLLNRQLCDQVVEQAKLSQRLRQNYNIHKDYADPCQRLLNALEPGTYVRPHRHLTPPKAECFIALRGRMAAVIFADDGRLEEVVEFAPDAAVLGLDIPAGCWHAIVALETGSLFFECKPGPYEPLSDKDWAPWAPLEGETEAAAYLQQLVAQVQCRLVG